MSAAFGKQGFQESRHARRIYVGGFPPNCGDEEALKFFLNSVIAKGLGEPNDNSYVLSIYVNKIKCFAFVELRAIELATACLDLDGIIYKKVALKVLRSNEYKPELIAPSLVGAPITLDLSSFCFATPTTATTATDPGSGNGNVGRTLVQSLVGVTTGTNETKKASKQPPTRICWTTVLHAQIGQHYLVVVENGLLRYFEDCYNPIFYVQERGKLNLRGCTCLRKVVLGLNSLQLLITSNVDPSKNITLQFGTAQLVEEWRGIILLHCTFAQSLSANYAIHTPTPVEQLLQAEQERLVANILPGSLVPADLKMESLVSTAEAVVWMKEHVGDAAVRDAVQGAEMLHPFVLPNNHTEQHNFECNKEAARKLLVRMREVVYLLPVLQHVTDILNSACLVSHVSSISTTVTEAGAYFQLFTHESFLQTLMRGTEPKDKFDGYDRTLENKISGVRLLVGSESFMLQSRTSDSLMLLRADIGGVAGAKTAVNLYSPISVSFLASTPHQIAVRTDAVPGASSYVPKGIALSAGDHLKDRTEQALYGRMLLHPDDVNVLGQCISGLLQCQDSSTNDLSSHLDLLLHIACRFTGEFVLISELFQYLSTVAPRLRRSLTGARLEELLHYIAEAMNRHRPNKTVQRAGLQLYEAILQLESVATQQTTARKVCRAVIDTIQHNIDDPFLSDVTHTAMRTLVKKQGAIISPWIDSIVGLVITSISQLNSAELVSQWLLVLEKVATTHAALTAMAAHPQCLNVLATALGILDHTQMGAAGVAVEYLLRLFQDDQLMLLVTEDLAGKQPAHMEYLQQLRDELVTNSDKFLDIAAQATNIDVNAMQSLLELLKQTKNHMDNMLAVGSPLVVRQAGSLDSFQSSVTSQNNSVVNPRVDEPRNSALVGEKADAGKLDRDSVREIVSYIDGMIRRKRFEDKNIAYVSYGFYQKYVFTLCTAKGCEATGRDVAGLRSKYWPQHGSDQVDFTYEELDADYSLVYSSDVAAGSTLCTIQEEGRGTAGLVVRWVKENLSQEALEKWGLTETSDEQFAIVTAAHVVLQACKVQAPAFFLSGTAVTFADVRGIEKNPLETKLTTYYSPEGCSHVFYDIALCTVSPTTRFDITQANKINFKFKGFKDNVPFDIPVDGVVRDIWRHDDIPVHKQRSEEHRFFFVGHHNKSYGKYITRLMHQGVDYIVCALQVEEGDSGGLLFELVDREDTGPNCNLIAIGILSRIILPKGTSKQSKPSAGMWLGKKPEVPTVPAWFTPLTYLNLEVIEVIGDSLNDSPSTFTTNATTSGPASPV